MPEWFEKYLNGLDREESVELAEYIARYASVETVADILEALPYGVGDTDEA